MLAAMPTAELDLPGPLDVPRSLEVFRRWGDDLADRWDGEVLVRTLRHDGATVAWAATPAGDVASPRLRHRAGALRGAPRQRPGRRRGRGPAPRGAWLS